MYRFSNSLATGVRWGRLAERVAQRGSEVTEPRFDVLCHASCRQRSGSGGSSSSSGSSVVRALGSVVLTRLLLLLLLVALQAQDAQAAPG